MSLLGEKWTLGLIKNTLKAVLLIFLTYFMKSGPQKLFCTATDITVCEKLTLPYAQT